MAVSNHQGTFTCYFIFICWTRSRNWLLILWYLVFIIIRKSLAMVSAVIFVCRLSEKKKKKKLFISYFHQNSRNDKLLLAWVYEPVLHLEGYFKGKLQSSQIASNYIKILKVLILLLMDICRDSCNDLAFLVLDGLYFYCAVPNSRHMDGAITVGCPIRSRKWMCSSSISASFEEASGE